MTKARKPPALWKLVCDEASISRLRDNEAFHRLLDLGRHSNALLYGMSALVAVKGDDTPKGIRQRFGTFFYLGGTLFEAFELVPRLRPHFEQLPKWSEGFGQFGTDDDIRKRLRQKGDLHTLRNHTAFHFRPMVAPRSLKKLKLREYAFTAGSGKGIGELYFPLADVIGMHYVSGASGDARRFEAEFDRMARSTRDLALQYVTAADKLFGPALKTFGFRRSVEPLI